MSSDWRGNRFRNESEWIWLVRNEWTEYNWKSIRKNIQAVTIPTESWMPWVICEVESISFVISDFQQAQISRNHVQCLLDFVEIVDYVPILATVPRSHFLRYGNRYPNHKKRLLKVLYYERKIVLVFAYLQAEVYETFARVTEHHIILIENALY